VRAIQGLSLEKGLVGEEARRTPNKLRESLVLQRLVYWVMTASRFFQRYRFGDRIEYAFQ